MKDKELQTLSGVVEGIAFANAENGFTVMELDYGGELMTVVGIMPGISPGEEVELTGYYTNHATYGRQFKAELCERTLPATANAIYKYLSSGTIKGIGPKTARKIVDTFGDDTLNIIEKEPERLSEIPRISLKKAKEINEEYKQIFGIRSVMVALAKYGIDASVAISIWKQWGLASIDMVEENPYELCKEPVRLDFDIADDIATKLNIEHDDPMRLTAGIVHVLTHNLFNGHTCLPKDKIIQTAVAFLGVEQMHIEDSLFDSIKAEVLTEKNVKGIDYIYLPHIYEAESYIANRISLMLSIVPSDETDYNHEIDKLEQKLEIEYAELQKKAINLAVHQQAFILTGGPGTGKTTTLNGIINILEDLNQSVVLAAPTGRAAKRMSEVCGREAKTIHRLLEVEFRADGVDHITFKRNEQNPLRSDVVILDEVSMVDTEIFHHLLKACSLGCRLILVGDPDQLPSVGAGNILGDFIDSDVIPTVHLTEIFRQAKQSQIVIASHEIVQGAYPDLNSRDSDFFFMSKSDYDEIIFTTIDLCKRRLPKAYKYDPFWDIQVISPSRIGPLGTVELNRHLQNSLNPPTGSKTQQKFNGVFYREQDKIMQTRNNYDIVWESDLGEEGTGVFNGDIGIIEMIDRPSQSILIRYDDKVAAYNFDMLNEIEHAYAITVHKSQGSEFSAVIMPLMNFHSKLYYRNILYTAITRAKELMIIMGQQSTITRMVDNNRKVLRYTNLAGFLADSVLNITQ